ncbi:MAG: hypothetical protein ACFCU9_06610 [Cyanophyceae cyanobacterium]
MSQLGAAEVGIWLCIGIPSFPSHLLVEGITQVKPNWLNLTPERSNIGQLLLDPRASPVGLQRVMFGRGREGYQLGSKLRLSDNTGILPIRFVSPLGPLGNMFGGFKGITPLLGKPVVVKGWLRRGTTPWLDPGRIEGSGQTVRSHGGRWLILFGGGMIDLGILVWLRYAWVILYLDPRFWDQLFRRWSPMRLFRR